MNNSEIAARLDEIGDILEFQGANQFRVRAYRNAARVIHDLGEAVERIAADPERKLTEISGIGDDLAEKIKTLIQTGSIPQLEKLRAEVPESVLALMRIPGVGPKKAAILFKELGVKTLDELRAACEAHRVRELKGFGEKTEATILAGIGQATAPEAQRIYWAEADIVAQELLAHLDPCRSVKQIESAGSYRRGRETVGDLDIVAESADAAEVMDRLAEYPDLAAVLGRGDTKMSIRLQNGLQVDLRIVPKESFGAVLLYFTGSKQHNIVLRGLAKDRGLKINEYGVFRVPQAELYKDDDEPPAKSKRQPEKSAGRYIAGRTEAEVYATLDLPLFPPELREARQEFQWAAEGKLPKLIELADMQGDLHMHTTESDGKASLEEMVAAARERGLKYIAITDHSKRVSMAHGLDGPRLRKQWAQIDRLNEQIRNEESGGRGKAKHAPDAAVFQVLKGVEVDILERGGLDLPDDVLAEADWVVASVHYGQNQPLDQITRRIVEALEHPAVSAIAHPTGRIIGKRPPYAVDLETVFATAKRCGKLLELNANPKRLDLDDIHCAAAKRHGVPIVISTDAHAPIGLGCMRYGILQARRAGLTKGDVANTRPWKKMNQLLTRREIKP